MAHEDEKTVVALPLRHVGAFDDAGTVSGASNDTTLLLYPDGARGGQAVRRARETQEPPTVVLPPTPVRHAFVAWPRHTNPLLAAATPVLLLLGQLKSGAHDLQDRTLPNRLASEMSRWERNAWASGADLQEIEDCMCLLAATAEDVIEALPKVPGHTWGLAGFSRQGPDSSDAFRRIELALCFPGSKARRLEVMLACLSLGLGGSPGNTSTARELKRWREVVHQTLLQVAPAPRTISPCWQPVIPEAPVARRLPVWAVAVMGAVAAAFLFLPLALDLSHASAKALNRITGMHRDLAPLVLARPKIPETADAAVRPSQLDRLAEGLRDLNVTLTLESDWILLRLPQDLGFAPGEVGLDGTAAQIAERLGQVLEDESGVIRVIGHSDTLPLSGEGAFRTNAELSLARAQAVATGLARRLSDPSRLRAEGRGVLEPVADNTTPHGRAMNRRVEILIQKAP